MFFLQLELKEGPHKLNDTMCVFTKLANISYAAVIVKLEYSLYTIIGASINIISKHIDENINVPDLLVPSFLMQNSPFCISPNFTPSVLRSLPNFFSRIVFCSFKAFWSVEHPYSVFLFTAKHSLKKNVIVAFVSESRNTQTF